MNNIGEERVRVVGEMKQQGQYWAVKLSCRILNMSPQEIGLVLILFLAFVPRSFVRIGGYIGEYSKMQRSRET